MSKKFIVEISDDDVSCKDVKECFLSESYLVKSDNVTVTELSPLPDVKKIETGILMSPAEITGCESVCEVNYRRDGDKNVFRIYSDSVYKSFLGQRIDLSKHSFPREFYRKGSIETTWDFNSIPVGAVIEVVKNQDKHRYGRLEEVSGNRLLFGHWAVPIDEIKSIRIVELPKENQK